MRTRFDIWQKQEILGYKNEKDEAHCGLCNECCKNSEVDVDYEIKNGLSYRTRKVNGKYYLQRRKKDRSCVYLLKTGCSIEKTKKPLVCRSFDCMDKEWQKNIPAGHKVWNIIQIKGKQGE